MINLLNKKWYRNLFSMSTFVKLEDKTWINIKKYTKGKIIDVDGKWNTLAFCECGNELIHSNSFIKERETKNNCIFDFKCSHCGIMQYHNPDIIPGLAKCDINGNPI